MARYIELKVKGLTLCVEYDERDKCFTEVEIVQGKHTVPITKFTDDLYVVDGVDHPTFISLTDLIEDELRDRGMPIGD